eukprot:c24213_g1_i1 orf=617-3619(-)
MRMERRLFWALVILVRLLHLRREEQVLALSPDGLSLLSLKNSLVDSMDFLSDWTDAHSATPCSWTGVTCDSSLLVISLDLSVKNLSGTVSNDIQLLTGLISLNISNNLFSGPLPIFFTNLTNLRLLDISHNYFNGSFPEGFFKMKSLVHFTAYSNSFVGFLPVEFVHLPLLEHFDLGGSYFEGSIPPEYGAFTSLKYLDLSGNSLNGSIPLQLANLPKIELIKIGWNHYNGGIPVTFGNISTLKVLDLAGAGLTGSIPSSLGSLSNLNTLFLYKNQLMGNIPPQFGNLTSLMSLDLSQNRLIGSIPESFGNLRELELLSLMYNHLSGEIPTAIAHLPNLLAFLIWNNSFTGSLPQQLGKHSSLYWVDVSGNQFTGHLPPGLCDGGTLFKLILFSNRFSGSIPESLASCQALWRLRMEDNKLTGSIPSGFGLLQNFTYLDVSTNNLNGGIPPDLVTSSSLEFLDLSYNNLNSSIPPTTWKMRRLQTLHASSCKLRGTIGEISQCPPLISLDLSGNLLSGNIPADLGLCRKLIILILTKNHLSGVIPYQLASLPVLATLDVSHNELTGTIPVNFENSTALETFDVSYNNLTGPIPSEGLFRIINPSMLLGNEGLCGGVLSSCAISQNLMSPVIEKKVPRAMAWALVGVIFALTAIICVVGCQCFYKRYKWYICSKLRGDREGSWKLTTFQRLNFTADDIVQCLNRANIIGMGAAGVVYKANLPNGETIAVKMLWKSQKDVDYKGQEILGEVDVLGSVRHRNIVRLLGWCSNGDTTLLLYEYMPNGSLGDLLHGNKETNVLADWMTRYKIAMGVAQGLCYLHHDCFPVVVHRDVKSNNILLDTNMDARVADFGVAKLLERTESMSVIAGSYGYIAPEYAYTMQVDAKSDIYSFGVVLLELLTGKRPIEPEFGDNTNIVEWVREKTQTSEGVSLILDDDIGASLSSVREEMALVLRVALACTSNSPAERPSMRDVVTMMAEAKPRRKSIKQPIPASTTPDSRFS